LLIDNLEEASDVEGPATVAFEELAFPFFEQPVPSKSEVIAKACTKVDDLNAKQNTKFLPLRILFVNIVGQL
jgi:hypothetical protein